MNLLRLSLNYNLYKHATGEIVFYQKNKEKGQAVFIVNIGRMDLYYTIYKQPVLCYSNIPFIIPSILLLSFDIQSTA